MADLSALLSGARQQAATRAGGGQSGYRTISSNDPRLAQLRLNQQRIAQARSRPAGSDIDDLRKSTPVDFEALNRSAGNAPKSLFGQLKGMVQGIPQGISGLVSSAAVTAAAPIRMGVDMAQGDYDWSSDWGTVKEQSAKYTPLASQIIPSMVDTSRRVGGLISGNPSMMRGSLNQYKQASDEGRIVDMVVEDVGNVGAFASGAGKALGTTSRTTTVGNRAIAEAVEGGSRARSLSSAVADSRIGQRIIPPRLPRATTVTDAGKVIEMSTQAQRRGTGLAGLAERAGYERTAQALSTTGAGVRKVGRLGEAVDNVTFAWPAKAALKVASPVVKPLGKAAQAGVKHAARGEGVLADYASRLTPEGAEQRRVGREARAALAREGTAVQRALLEPAVISKRYGLSKEQARAATFAVDQRMAPLIQVARSITDNDQLQSLINRAYDDAPHPDLIPDVADVRAFIDWQDGRLDDTTAAAMSQVDEAMRDASDIRTEQYVKTGVLNPDQLDSQMREGKVAEVRGGIERKRDAALRDLDVEQRRLGSIERRALAQEAINTTLPEPPNPKRLIGQGRAVGEATERSAALRREHKMRVQEVKRALREWEAADAAASADAPTQRALESRLDKAIEQADTLRREIERTSRRRDATSALSRVEDRQVGDGLPVQPERPDIDLSDLDTPAAIKRAAKEIQDNDKRQARQRVADLTEGQIAGDGRVTQQTLVPRLGGAELGNIRPPKVIERLRREGYLGNKETNKGFEADQFQVAWESKTGRGFDDTYDTVDDYISEIENMWQAAEAGSDVVVTDLADTLGLPPEAIELALTGSAVEYRAMMQAITVDALDEVRDAWLSLDEADQQMLADEIGRLRAEGAPDAKYQELLYDALDELGPGAGVLEPIWSRVSMSDLSEWLTTGEIPSVMYETVVGKRGIGHERTIAKLGQKVTDLRAQVRQVESSQRSIRQVYDQVQRQADRTEASARKKLDDASSMEARSAAAADEVDVRPSLSEVSAPSARSNPWHRYREGSPSKAERMVFTEGALRGRASAQRAVTKRVQRRVKNWQQKIVDLPSELGRSFQERLRVDVNAPAIRGMRSTLRGIEREMGDLMLGEAGQRPSVSGLMGSLADKYGISDEVAAMLMDEMQHAQGDFQPQNKQRAIENALRENGVELSHPDRTALDNSFYTDQLLYEIDEIVRQSNELKQGANTPFRVIEHIRASRWADNLPDDPLSAVERKWESYIKRRNNYLTRLVDDQAAVMPGRYRAVGSNARRNVRALLDEAEDAYQRGDTQLSSSLISLAEDVPTTLDAMVKAGIDPTHMTGGEAPTLPTTIGGSGVRTRSLRAAHELGSGLRPLDLGAVGRLEVNEATKFLTNRAAEYMTAEYGKRVDAVIGEQMEQYRVDHFGREMPLDEVKQALDDAGWSVADAANPIAGRQSVVIPKAIATELTESARTPSGAWRILNKGNRAFKTAVLPLSPKWLIGNVVGNAFMAMFNGNVGPVELARTVIEISRMEGGLAEFYRRGGLPSWAPDELASHGLTYGEYQLLWGDEGMKGVLDEGGVRDGFNRLIRNSYNLNEFVDNTARSVTYLTQLRKGSSPETALRHSLNAMGDFTRMSPFERRVMREAFPFYSWLRHQTQAAIRLPLSSPTRAAFLLNLSNLMNDEDFGSDMLSLLGSKIGLGGNTFINIGGLSPFPGAVGDLPLDPTNPVGFLSNMTPIVDAPVRAVTGFDLSRLEPVSRPYDQRPANVYGQEMPLSPLRRLFDDPANALGEIGYQLSGEIAPTRSVRDALLGPGEARYGSGDRVGDGKYDREVYGGRLTTLLRGLNIPVPETVDLERMQREQREREIEERRQQRRANR